MHKNLLVFCFALCLLFGQQDVAKAWSSLSKTGKTMLQKQDSLKLDSGSIEGLNDENRLSLADSLLNAGKKAQQQGQYDEALENYREAKKLVEGIPGKGRETLAIAWIRMGSIYQVKLALEKQLECIEQAMEIGREAFGERHLFIAEVWNNFGNYHHFAGNHSFALNCYLKAYDLKKELLGANHFALASTTSNLGNQFKRQGKNEEAVEYYLRSLEIIEKNQGKNSHFCLKVLPNLASAYQNMKNDAQVEKTLLKALEVARVNESKLPGMALEIGKILWQLGSLHQTRGKFDPARSYFLQSAEATKKIFGEKDPRLASALIGLGDLEIDAGDPDAALRFYQQALCANVFQFEEADNILINPTATAYTPDNYGLISTLWKKGYGLRARYRLKAEENDLELALQNYLLADSLTDRHRLHLINREDQIRFTAATRAVYTGGIDNCFELFEATSDRQYLEKAFYFSEKYSEAVLRQAIADDQALQFADLPPAVLKQESELKAKQAETELQLIQALQAQDDDRQIEQRNHLFEIKTEYRQFQEMLEKNYPDYRRLKYDFSSATLADINSDLLGKNAAFLKFFDIGKSIFCMVVFDGEIVVEKFNVPATFGTEINEFRNLMGAFGSPPISEPGQTNQFAEKAFWFYQLLLEKPLQHLAGKNIERLVIALHGPIARLPFEMTLTSKPETNLPADYSNLPYLFRSYALSYVPSATFLLKNKNRKKEKRAKRLAAFAPSYDQATQLILDSVKQNIALRSGLQDLPFARQYTSEIARLFHGKAFLAEEATVDNFRKNAANYRILHLAMHGEVDHENPLLTRLVFTPDADSSAENAITAAEVYNLSLRADLAVLSACNTSVGTFEPGEGLMSMARAFAYGGCPSMLASLWSVPDEATGRLMLEFYKSLKQGAPKDEALSVAKLRYLASPDIPPAFKHPFFWAGFVQTGDTTPIALNGNRFASIWTGGVFAALLFGSIFFYKFRGRKSA